MKFRYSILFLWLTFCAFLFSWIKPGYAQHKVLSSLEEDITSLVESIKPSLVTIETEGQIVKSERRKNMPSTFVGSGIVYTSDGYILTTVSVLSGMRSFKVTLPDQKSLKGKLVGTDEESNLAVLKVEATDLIPAKLGNSDKIKVGSWLTVVGNSFGLPNAVALGLVNGVREDGFIQMSANVSPGNSGGPVLDTYGRVIGLVSAKLSESTYIGAIQIYNDKSMKTAFTIPPRAIELPSSGVSLALPVNKIKVIADEIIKHGSVRRGYLGIYPQNLGQRLSEKYNVRGGVLIEGVVEGSPANKAGLSEDDVIIEFGGTEVKNVAHIRQLIYSRRADETVKLKIKRDDKIKELTVVLGAAKSAFSYSRRTDFDVLTPGYDYFIAYEGVQNFQQLTEQDKQLLDQLREELDQLKRNMERLSKELEKLKLERSKE